MIEKKPFTNYRVGEKDILIEGKVFTVRMNAEEYLRLRQMAKILHISNDSTCLKFCADFGQNVLLRQIGDKTLSWLTDPNRRINEPKLEQPLPVSDQNVTQK